MKSSLWDKRDIPPADWLIAMVDPSSWQRWICNLFDSKYVQDIYVFVFISDPPISDEKATIKSKYLKFLENYKIFGFEFCNNLLNNSKLKSFEQDESIIFEGYLLLSHLQILIFCTNVECFENNGENLEVKSKQCIPMSLDIQEFYLPFRGSGDFDYANVWAESNAITAEVDLFQDCYGDLLYDLIKVLTPISPNSWFIFYEDKYSNGKTLQTEIGKIYQDWFFHFKH